MLRILYRQKQTRPHIRSYYRRPYYVNYVIPRLPQQNLFNTPTENLLRSQMTQLVHDLFDRNEQFRGHSSEQESILELQKNILRSWMSGHADQLDTETLSNLEDKLRKTFPQRSSGHANE